MTTTTTIPCHFNNQNSKLTSFINKKMKSQAKSSASLSDAAAFNKRKYNKERSAKVREAKKKERLGVDAFRLPVTNPSRQEFALHEAAEALPGGSAIIGKTAWKSGESPEMRRLLVLYSGVQPHRSYFGEVPHFGSSDDAEILDSPATVHELTLLASNISTNTVELLTVEKKLDNLHNVETRLDELTSRLQQLENRVSAIEGLLGGH